MDYCQLYHICSLLGAFANGEFTVWPKSLTKTLMVYTCSTIHQSTVQYSHLSEHQYFNSSTYKPWQFLDHTPSL